MRRFRGWATARYALAWMVPLLVVAVVASQLLGEERRDLERAAREASCVLRTDSTAADDLPDVMVPPTFGPPAVPAAAGMYRESPPRRALVGALRRGFVIVQYRPGTPEGEVAQLESLVRGDLELTILTPDATGMPYAVAATAWTRLLACTRIDTETLTALHEFRDHNRGRGPREEEGP